MNQHRSMKEWDKVAKEFGCCDMRDLLYKYYVNQGMTTRKIAAEVLDTSRDTVVRLLRIVDIPLRKRGGIH